MKRLIISILAIAIVGMLAATAQSKPTRKVKMPTESNLGIGTNDYTTYETGFYAAGELSGGYSLNSGRDNLGFSDVTFVGGYRFGEYLRAGIGIGARLYVDAAVRNMSHDWGMPLFINLRGNFIPTGYRDAVPFWSMDVGTTFPDGVMIRPAFGVRVGQKRSAFVASVGYMGQDIRTAKVVESQGAQVGKAFRKFYSFITLRLGYEF